MGIYEGLKDAAGILKEAGKIDQYEKILDAQAKMFEMQKRIEDLEIENKDLRKQQEIKSVIVARDNMYWIDNDGPFCTCCWDAGSKLIRLHISRDTESAECPNCKTRARPGRAIIFHQNISRINSAR